MHSARFHHWGESPWIIDFVPQRPTLPSFVDAAVVGGGFTGLASAAWLRLLAPEQSVAVFESGRIGWGASGRTGGMVLAESADGDLPGLGNVLAGFSEILSKLGVECDLSLPGAWEIARKGTAKNTQIDWDDSGKVRVVGEVPGGTLHPGKLVGGLGRAAQRLGVCIAEEHRVRKVRWGDRVELEIDLPGEGQTRKVSAGKVFFATNALSLSLSGLSQQTHPKLTLAAMTAPLSEQKLSAIGLAAGKPFYTVDFPYLWGRTLPDGAIVWGAGLVDAPRSDDLEQVDIAEAEPSRMFASLEKRVLHLHPALASAEFTHRWGGPILFREGWRPVFDFHPRSRNAIVLGAYAGHGVALSSYLGAWAAEALLGRRKLPDWGALHR